MSWAVLFITSVLFCTYCAAQYSVTQPATQSVSPGNTATLSCTTTGFSISDRWVGWYQQKSGERPRYLLWYDNDSNKHQGDGVPDRFSGSKDNSKNTAYLTIKSASLEDDAVYYCAMWQPTIKQFIFGGGTYLSVPTGEVKVPIVLMYAPSKEQLDKNLATVVCNAFDFTPRTASIEWQVDGKSWTAGVSTTTISKQSNNLYMASSFLSMSSSDYNTHESYSCKVRHESKDYVKILKRSECQ